MPPQPNIDSFVAGADGALQDMGDSASELDALLDARPDNIPTDGAPATETPAPALHGTEGDPAAAPGGLGEAKPAPAAPGASEAAPKPEGDPKPPETPTTPPEKPEEAPELVELEKLEPPKGISKEGREGWATLKGKAKEAFGKVAEAAAKVLKLEQEVAALRDKTKGLEDVDPQKYRQIRDRLRLLDAEADPEFQTEWQGKVAAADEAVIESLRANGMKEDLITKLKEKGLDKISEVWWQDNVLKRLPLVERQILERRLADRILVRRDRERLVAESRANREKSIAERAKEQEKEADEAGKRLEALVADKPWALPMELDPKATPEQRKEVAAHNAHQAELDKAFKRYIASSTLPEKVEMAVEAVRAIHLDKELKELQTQLAQRDATIAEMQKKVDGLKGGAGVSRVPPSAPPPPRDGNRGPENLKESIDMDSMDAITAGLDAVRRR